MTDLPMADDRFPVDRPEARRLLSVFNTSWKMRLFMLSKLPSLFFWGVRIKSCVPGRAEVTIPYGWRTQNPFRSVYFAALSGAAELSTGLLAMLALAGRGRISMLITRVEAEYVKKAVSRVTFTCGEGRPLNAAVEQAISTGQAQTITVHSTGRQENGEEVARLRFTWSFKVKEPLS